MAEAITVNALDINDNRASFSNWGTCADLFAPGVSITSAWSTGDSATNAISGTSMAAPHVAGAAALYLSANPSAVPQAVRNAIVGNATPNKIANPGANSPNLLLFTGQADVPQPSPDRLLRNQSLQVNQSIVSQNGAYILLMQSDGNLVLYTSAWRPLWATNTVGTGANVAIMQGDGNFVLYTPGGRAVWHTNTWGTAADRLIVQNDGNLVVYSPGGQVFWARR